MQEGNGRIEGRLEFRDKLNKIKKNSCKSKKYRNSIYVVRGLIPRQKVKKQEKSKLKNAVLFINFYK